MNDQISVADISLVTTEIHTFEGRARQMPVCVLGSRKPTRLEVDSSVIANLLEDLRFTCVKGELSDDVKGSLPYVLKIFARRFGLGLDKAWCHAFPMVHLPTGASYVGMRFAHKHVRENTLLVTVIRSTAFNPYASGWDDEQATYAFGDAIDTPAGFKKLEEQYEGGEHPALPYADSIAMAIWPTRPSNSRVCGNLPDERALVTEVSFTMIPLIH